MKQDLKLQIAVLQEKDHLLDKFLFVNKKGRSPVWVTFFALYECVIGWWNGGGIWRNLSVSRYSMSNRRYRYISILLFF